MNKISAIEQNIEEQKKNLDKKIEEKVSIVENRLVDVINKREQELLKKVEIFETKINSFKESMEQFAKGFDIFQSSIKERIKTQMDVYNSRINQVKEQFVTEKNKTSATLETLKTQQDVLKISYAVNEKSLIEKIQEITQNEVYQLVKGKENEILMKLWIKELKDIVNDFEKLKKMAPKEVLLQIDEISNAIDIFKQKLDK